jgi:hypothetical protein
LTGSTARAFLNHSTVCPSACPVNLIQHIQNNNQQY